MKKSVSWIVVGMALALGVSQGVVASETKKPPEIPWFSSFDTALKLAKKQAKPIFLDFYNPK